MSAAFSDPSVCNSLKLTPVEARKVLDALNRRGGGAPTGRQRRVRVPYENPNVIIECDDGGGRLVRYRVQARNLSTHGIGIIHGQFMHVKRPCVIEMLTQDAGASIRIPSRIERCRLVAGRIHEIGIVFTKPIDLSLFVELDVASEMKARTELQSDNAEAAGRKPVGGTVLAGKAMIAEDFESNRKLYAFWLSKMGLSISEAPNKETVSELLKANKFDVILIDQHLGDAQGSTIIKEIRDQGNTSLIIAVSAEVSEVVKDACINSGADLFLPKPFDRDVLQRAIFEKLVGDKHAAHQRDAIHSTLASDQEMLPLIRDFVGSLAPLGTQIQQSLTTGDMPKLQSVLMNLVEAGRGYGFADVTEVAQATLKVTQTPTAKPLDLRRGIERTLSVIKRCAA